MRTIEAKQKLTQLVVGILTSEGKQSPICGNLQLFKEISLAINNLGGKVILFTPSALIDGELKFGYIFHEPLRKWMLVYKFSIPTLIYNRIPYRKDEESDDFKAFLAWCDDQAIPVFNRRFLSKWDVYTILKEDQVLANYLPESELIVSLEQLERLLNNYSSLYLKPIEGSKGNGIFVLTKLKGESFQVKTHGESFGSSSLSSIWNNKLLPLFSKINHLAQPNIELKTQNNRSFDFRLLAHRIGKHWVVSGMGVRQRQAGGITSHTLKGGTILKLNEVATPDDIEKLKQITARCGTTLTKKYADLKEFSMDIGKSKDGKFYIFEVNAKPMKFDEIDIYEQGIKNLVRIFSHFTK